MVDAITPKTVGQIQKVKRVKSSTDKTSGLPERKTDDDSDTEESGMDQPRRGTRIDDHA